MKEEVDQNQNYYDTVRILQEILNKATEIEAGAKDNDLIKFITYAIGSLMAHSVYNALSWETKETITDEQKIEVMVENIAVRFGKVLRVLRNEPEPVYDDGKRPEYLN